MTSSINILSLFLHFIDQWSAQKYTFIPAWIKRFDKPKQIFSLSPILKWKSMAKGPEHLCLWPELALKYNTALVKNSCLKIGRKKLWLSLGHWGFATKLMAQVCSKDPVVDRSVPDVAATVGGDGGRLHLHLQPPGSAPGSRLVLTQVVLMAHQVEMVGGSTSPPLHLHLDLPWCRAQSGFKTKPSSSQLNYHVIQLSSF